MLTGLDETLRHQLPTTFDHVGTSDPRFYDRYWFSCYDPEGQLAAIIGMGLYNNMNVLDGFIALQTPLPAGGSQQRNFRFSRTLRPEIDRTAVGPLEIEIVDPFKHARVTIEESDLPVSAELSWVGFLPPKEEDHHFRRVRGRVSQDYRRYTQVGDMYGSITLDGREYKVSRWWGGRDHSWGVRPATAGAEPVTGPPDPPDRARKGSVFFWVPFSIDTLGGHVQVHTFGDGTQIYRDGVIQFADGKESEVTDVDFEVDFHPGTRRWKQVRSRFTTRDRQTYEVVADQLLRDWSMDGTGYDWGWNDGGGLGVWRGDYYQETDTYDLSHPEQVVRPDGSARTPGHREAPARLTVNGRPGMGHQIVIANGPVPFLGLT